MLAEGTLFAGVQQVSPLRAEALPPKERDDEEADLEFSAVNL
jgi:hypothetical protein